ncbi:MAG: GNAT family N-acetyltransferase [Flavobacteriales bacterium]|nr:GNAT family N-acetyltransferase [Flavobacteriales bacterium]
MEFKIEVASKEHLDKAQEICDLIETAALKRGTGIAKRSPKYIQEKMSEGKAVIAIGEEGDLAGFCYIETWQHGKYAVNSGLIISPNYQGLGLARKVKNRAFELSRKKFPEAKMFGLTTSLPVMKINSDLGYRPVTFSELTEDESFWKGCQSCVNFDILTRTERKHCLCTGMLFDPKAEKKKKAKAKKAEKENAGEKSWADEKENFLKKS